MAKTSVIGKIYNMTKEPYKKDGVDKFRLEFTVGERTNRKYPEGHERAGQRVTEFYRIKAFNGLAEVLEKNFKNEDWIVIEGEIQLDSYTRKVNVNIPTATGTVQQTLEVPNTLSLTIMADGFKFVGDSEEYTNTPRGINLALGDGVQVLEGAALSVAPRTPANEAPANTAPTAPAVNPAITAMLANIPNAQYLSNEQQLQLALQLAGAAVTAQGTQVPVGAGAPAGNNTAPF